MKNYLITYSYEPSGSFWNTPDIRYGNYIVQVESLNVKKIDEIINFLQINVNTNVTIHNIIKLDE